MWSLVSFFEIFLRKPFDIFHMFFFFYGFFFWIGPSENIFFSLGETLVGALKREIMEETGFKVFVPEQNFFHSLEIINPLKV
jgi:hypothetical protein